ncbi:alpha/beta fold hydrolase [Cytobacillus dafuensis]|uniref:Alpha/beta hydrolase n=1 Tax=Cytobacillus dafuensis TaxID=1742359 RepID=A0A5B8Z0I3_CYTDA|nr:alpha/beta hydrolase [Cytobacillus dafuensis]QED46398.1 alpha/beta hydrolase [Cytobacillus dafuensis]
MLHYRSFYMNDDTPWVTLIHGAGGNSSIWYKQLREYKKHFNVLLIDLRGHGESTNSMWQKGDSFEQVADEVLEVLDHLKIKKTHFVGISLGTIVIQTIAKKQPDRFQSMVLGGAVTKLNLRTSFLVSIGNLMKRIIPYMWIVSLFAWILMPKENHKEARKKFVFEAKKMCQKEFINWFSLTKRVNPFLKSMQKDFFGIPTLFVMGEEDYLFLEDAQMVVIATKDTTFETIKNAGHVCNIDQPRRFNDVTIKFMFNHNRNVMLPILHA